jgi:hypothetical protein
VRIVDASVVVAAGEHRVRGVVDVDDVHSSTTALGVVALVDGVGETAVLMGMPDIPIVISDPVKA